MIVGLVGIGAMGAPMAKRLLLSGYRVYGFDVRGAALEELRALGGNPCESAAEVARQVGAGVLVISLPGPPQQEQVYLGERGLLAAASRGLTVVDTTTSLPDHAKSFYSAAREKGVAVLDAAVSGGETAGGPASAATGQLTMMIGGDAEAYEAASGVLRSLGKKIYHVGPSGAGTAIKLINNMLSMCETVAVCEAFVLGAKAGIPASKLFEVLSNSGANSATLEKKGPRVVNRDFKAGFKVSLMLKDLDLVATLGRQLGATTFMAGLARDLAALAIAQELGDLDRIGLLQLFERLSRVQVE